MDQGTRLTENQFHFQYGRLMEAFPTAYPAARKSKIAELVVGMSYEWFSTQVDRMIERENPNCDWEWCVKQEKERLKPTKPKEKVVISEEGFQKALKQFGATSALEAVMKNRGGAT